MACKILQSMGMTQNKIALDIFMGQILTDKPPQYLKLYFNDFIYFSEYEVEKHFEKKFLISHL